MDAMSTPTHYKDARGRRWTVEQSRSFYLAELAEGYVRATCLHLPRLLAALGLTPIKPVTKNVTRTMTRGKRRPPKSKG